MYAQTDAVGQQLQRLRAQAIAQRLSGPLEGWSAELQALESSLDRLLVTLLEPLLSQERLQTWRSFSTQRLELEPELRLDRLIMQLQDALQLEESLRLMSAAPRETEGTSHPRRPRTLELVREKAEESQTFTLPDSLHLTLALDLIPWVLGRDEELQALLERLRQNIFREHGVKLPAIRLSDASTLPPGTYKLEIRGEEAARGKLRGLECMVLDAPPDAFEGVAGHEPAFHMPGIWIQPSLREVARSEGYTVLTPVDMFLAHLTEVVRTRLHELFGAAQLHQDLSLLERRLPGLIATLRRQGPGEGQVLRVLRMLLEEGLSIRDLETIFEALLELGGAALPAEVMTAHVRRALRRHISARFVDDEGLLHTFVLAADLEGRLLATVQDERTHELSPELKARLMKVVQQQLERWNHPVPPVLVVPDPLRFTLRRALTSLIRVLPVLAVGELVSEVKIQHCGELSVPVHLERVM
ncbi:MAG: FHIPEP family type III secretion protein [Myxococcota bacterium]